MDLVKRVASKLEQELGTNCERCEASIGDMHYAARAAITEMLDAMMEPGHEITEAVVEPGEDRRWAVNHWQAMLSQFRKENGL